VVLLVPPPVDREVDGLRRALGSGALGRIPPHVTLVPPVNLAEEDLDQALEVMRAAGGATRPLDLELGPTATFWPDNRVVYLSVGGDLERTGALRRRLMTGPLSRREGRPFVAHVTLTAKAPAAAIPWIVESLGSFRSRVVVDRVHLLLEGPGRVWEPLADVALAARAVVGRGGLELELARSERADASAREWSSAEWAAYSLATYGPQWSPDEGFAVTARRQAAVVGLAEGVMRGDTCVLERLIVDRGARGEGVGTALVAAVESAAAEAGCVRCVLRTPAGGRAESFYRGRGWVSRLALPSWRGGIDFVVMERRLGEGPAAVS
jgi:2'-5' RNA ligase/GNAT superfamily N-acetyltransferase